MPLPQNLRSVHPFPARMAPEVVWEELPRRSVRRLRVLDPMAGSGTTLVTAKLRGHEAIGYDSDPLAVLIARSWLASVRPADIMVKTAEVLKKARSRARAITVANAYPCGADDETRSFVRYWFDITNRVQLTALSASIARLQDPSLRELMWCAFSRLIITKTIGASLAMDVSHSRPHRCYQKAPINAFDRFEQSVVRITEASPFLAPNAQYSAGSVELADARRLPIGNSSVDIVITSPPYLNAIDYIRGHKFSLIWMGYSLERLRAIRATNVGTETSAKTREGDEATEHIITKMCSVNDLSPRNRGMLRGYVRDMRGILSETKRVLRSGGKAIFVVGNCNLRETYVQNSNCIKTLAGELEMRVVKVRRRALPENRRYLPPPESSSPCNALKRRMREEVILTLSKG
jgi:SAM-dependent methyltransferase